MKVAYLCVRISFLLIAGLVVGCGDHSGEEGMGLIRSRVDSAFNAGKSNFNNRPDAAYYFFSQAMILCDSVKYLEPMPKILYNLAMLTVVSGNMKQALILFDSSLSLASKNKDHIIEANCYNTLGNIEKDLTHPAKAREFFVKSRDIALQNKLNQQAGVALGSLASLETNTVKSITLDMKALDYLSKEKGTEQERAYIVINLANRQSSPDSAISLYKKAIELGKKSGNYEILASAYNNLAYSYLEKKLTDSAEVCIRDFGIPAAEKSGSADWLWNLYDSWADVLKSRNKFKESLRIKE